jgi:spindle assembly abnormal protein 6
MGTTIKTIIRFFNDVIWRVNCFNSNKKGKLAETTKILMLAAAAEGGSNVPAMSLAPSVGTIFQGDLLFQKQIPVMVKQQQHQPQQFSTSHLPPSSSSASMAGGSHSQASCPPTPLLFGNTVPTTFQHTQQAGTAAFCLQRRQIVTATVCFGYKNTLLSTGQQTLTSVNRPKFLQITLTDEQDPYFLYQLEIGEDEFVELKNEQNLLVDFAEFPWKFIELLEECIRAGSLDSAGGSGGATVGSPSSPKFLAQLINFSSMTTGPSARSLFTVVETNSFKHITHLSLQFLPGTDVTVKKYLASLVQSYKEQSARLQSQLSSTDSQLRAELKSMSDECGRLKESLGCLRFDSSESENRLRLQHADELGRERERLAREKEAAVRELENVKNGMMARYEQQLSQVTVQLHELQNEHSTATSRLRLVEDQLAAARLRAEELTRDNESLRTESARMREEKSESVGARQELERLLNAMRKRCEDSEAALNEKSANLARIEDSAGASRLQQAQLTEELQQYKSQANELEQQLSLSANEINKANEIIMKLQSDLKSNKSKLKLKNVVTIQQEKLIDEKQSFIDASQKEQAELKELLARRDGEVDTLRKDNDRLKAQIEEGKKVIAENNNGKRVIVMLLKSD